MTGAALATGGHRDWFDYIGTLLLPVVIAAGGILYTWHKDEIDSNRAEVQRSDDRARLAWERDAGYVKLLASANDGERQLGLQIIQVLSDEKRFSADLVPVVSAYVAARRPSDPDTQTAQRILVANPDKTSPTQQALASGVATNVPIPVFIQIARPDQYELAATLEAALSQANFSTNDSEVVPHTAELNYVRYFTADPSGLKHAEQIAALMADKGIIATVQDFSKKVKTPLSSIEIWIGKKQGVLPAAKSAR